jgi:CheY-like chemotaxis protein
MGNETIQIDLAQLLAQRGAFGVALAGELGARLGRTFSVESGPHQALGVLEIAGDGTPLVHQELRFAKSAGALHVVLPQRDARLLVALEQAVPADALDAALAEELDAARCAALAQVMESVVDVMRTSFAAARWPELSPGEPRVVPQPHSDASWLDDSVYLRLRFVLAVEGCEPGQLDILVRQGDLEGDVPRADSVCFVTLGEAERKRISALEAEIGASAVTIEPRELASALDDRVLGARLVVVPWELLGRSGLEVIEGLAREPRLAGVRLALGFRRPTRALVSAALRAGATDVLSHPYDAAQIRGALEAPKR